MRSNAGQVRVFGRWVGGGLAAAVMCALFASGLDAKNAAPGAGGSVSEETVRISGPLAGLQLGLRHATLRDAKLDPQGVVLMLHGQAVGVSGNPDYPLAGQSMMSALAQSGLDVWALDFYGYGNSDRYPEMSQPADSHPPLGRAAECADQVASAVRFLLTREHAERIMLLGDSGGTIVAGLFAARHPELISRLVLFGPMTPFPQGTPTDEPLPAYTFFTPQQVWAILTSRADSAGPPPVLDPNEYAAWAATFLRSDPTSRTRTPPSVQVPNGREADVVAIETGQYPFDPHKIRAPTLIVMGETDDVATFPGAQWLLSSLQASSERRLVVIGHGSHTVQFETERVQLYRVISDFLNEER
jgi:pimeloyl-ACP methyl ester carboxylesterase